MRNLFDIKEYHRSIKEQMTKYLNEHATPVIEKKGNNCFCRTTCVLCLQTYRADDDTIVCINGDYGLPICDACAKQIEEDPERTKGVSP